MNKGDYYIYFWRMAVYKVFFSSDTIVCGRNPVFSLDVRPALDNPTAIYDRITEWARQKRERWLGAGQDGAGTERSGR
jgi:hypothetical protein